MKHADRPHGDLFSKTPKLGQKYSPLHSSPPDGSLFRPTDLNVDEDKKIEQKYVLANNQRNYALTGESDNPTPTNNGVLEKRDQLPDRLQQLINDIVALSAGPYFTPEEWNSGHVDRQETREDWSVRNDRLKSSDDPENVDIKNIDPVETDHYETPYNSPTDFWEDFCNITAYSRKLRDDVFFHGEYALSKETQLGFELGNLLWMLKPEKNKQDPPGIDLIWGFILSFIGNSHSDVGEEIETLKQL
ncbi:MAG: hypothetical protein ABEI86_15340, partial [Halobacteriaceae archaeon]